MADPRLIVFDMDGTLVDSQHVILATMRAAFAAVGAEPPSDAAILGIVGLSLPEAVAVLAAPLGTRAQGEIVAGYIRGYAAAAAMAAPLYPGARAALDRLSAHPATLLGVATGKGRRGLDHVFATHGLARYFVTAQTADLHPSKPHPAMLAAALAETGCGPDAAVMVGDTEFDVLMGRAARFATIGVTWGYHSADRLRAAGADLLIESFDALDDALATLSGPPPR